MITLQVGVKIFLRNNEGKYLLVKRSGEKYQHIAGMWDIPGGRIEPGTTLLENLKREVIEETQLEIAEEPVLIFAQDIMKEYEKHIVRLTYKGEASGTPILDTSEHTEFMWITLSEMKKQEGLDPFVSEILEKGLLG